jgi:predicted dehydrogenase
MHTSSPVSRRRFLRNVAIAGSAPLILRSSAWAAPTSPNDQITLGFVGMGTQNRGLLNGFIGRNDTRVLAVCDVDTTRRQNAKRIVEEHYGQNSPGGTYKGCAAYGDFRELLARKDIDGVVIATPDHWHALVAIAAAKAKKDIYCEKPMAHTILEGKGMVEAVRSNERILQVGSMQRSSSEFRAACEMVRNGVIGTVKAADVCISGPPKPCDLPGEAAEPGLDWSFWLGPAPFRPYSPVLSPRGVHTHFPDWRNYREYGGGGVCDWGAHHFDIVQWAFGFDRSGPVEIIAAEKPDAVSGAKVRYTNGLIVTHQPGNGITFYGDKGKIYVNRGKLSLWLGDKLKSEDPKECEALLPELLPANAVKLYDSGNHLGNWIDCIRSRKAPICDVETGQRTATVCNLVNLSYFHHQNIHWDPATENFPPGTGQAAWLTREYRQPWKL